MPKRLTQKTMNLIASAYMILKFENPMTLRQLFYRLVSARIIDNSKADYQSLSRVMTEAIEMRHIEPDWIVDRIKPEIIPNAWADTKEYLKAVECSYKRDYWQDQPYYTEVWIGKDSLTGSIEETVREFGITLRAHRGYGSTTKKMEIAHLFDGIDKPIVIFYIGDFDPSGVDIERDLLAKIVEYQRTDNHPKIKRLAILGEDIEGVNLRFR